MHLTLKTLTARLGLMCLVLIAGQFVAPISQVRADTITYAGALLDLGSGWRTATVSKGAFSTTNILGTDGYYVVGSQGSSRVPSYVASFGTGGYYGGNSAYAAIDNPATTPGASPSLIRTGTFNGASTTPFSFTIGPVAIGQFQVGLMIDNLDNTTFNDSGLYLTDTAGATSTTVDVSGIGNSFNDLDPDWVFFDISGATAGETFTVHGTPGRSGQVTLGAISFDSGNVQVAVPEGQSLIFLGTSLLFTALLRRRNRPSRTIA